MITSACSFGACGVSALLRVRAVRGRVVEVGKPNRDDLRGLRLPITNANQLTVLHHRTLALARRPGRVHGSRITNSSVACNALRDRWLEPIILAGVCTAHHERCTERCTERCYRFDVARD